MPEEKSLQSKVEEHSIAIGVLVKSVNSIEGFMKQSLESQMRQEVLIEKLANFESNTQSSFDRVHARIDLIELNIKSVEISIKDMEPVVLSSKRISNGLIWTAKTLGAIVVAMLFGFLVWLIKNTNYTPSGF